VAGADLPSYSVRRYGQELIARAIHRKSKRRAGHSRVNCAAIAPRSLHPSCSATRKDPQPARWQRRIGRSKQLTAERSSSDEVGELPPESPGSCSGCQEESSSGWKQPAGPVDVRVLAASNRD